MGGRIRRHRIPRAEPAVVERAVAAAESVPDTRAQLRAAGGGVALSYRVQEREQAAWVVWGVDRHGLPMAVDGNATEKVFGVATALRDRAVQRRLALAWLYRRYPKVAPLVRNGAGDWVAAAVNGKYPIARPVEEEVPSEAE